MPELLRAERLRSLHRGPRPLLLANAWDAASARAFAEVGLPAVATSSHAVAAVLGYADGESTPAEEMFAAVARIARAVEVPVTADIEAGYGLAPNELVARLAEAGVVGCNLEDSDPASGQMVPVEAQAERLAAVAEAARSAGTGLVINARIDTFIRHAGAPEERLEAALERSRRYLAAGADCVYLITLGDEEAIAAFVRGAGGPVNILARPGAPSLKRLAELGVARVSFGGGLHRAVEGAVAGMAERLAAGEAPWPGTEGFPGITLNEVR